MHDELSATGADASRYFLDHGDGVAARIDQESTDCVALRLRNGPELIIAYFAFFSSGVIAAPRDTRLKTIELTALLRRLGPSLYPGQADLLGHADR